MKVNNALSPPVVAVPPNFWPLFFGSELQRKIVGEAVCFCLCDKLRRTQLIVVVPSIGARQLPSMAEVSSQFSFYVVGKKYNDPDELPVSIDDLAGVIGFYYEKVKSDGVTVYILTPVWDEDILVDSGDLFHYLRFESLPNQSRRLFLSALSSEEIVYSHYCTITGDFRIIFNVRNTFQLTLNDGVASLLTIHGGHIIPLNGSPTPEGNLFEAFKHGRRKAEPD